LLILGIDTSGKVASVALMQDDIIIGENTIYTTLTHSQVIMPMCKNLLESCNKTLQDVDRIAVSCGPGSYTGLRIGIAGVKAMSFALNIGCNGISTLESLANNVSCSGLNICAIMKARQNLVYCGLFSSNNQKVTRTQEDMIVDRNQLFDILKSKDTPFILVGDGAKDFYNDFKDDNLILSSPHLRLQSSSSLCEIASYLEPQTPNDLEALYLQPTKAEKDLSKQSV